MTTTPERRTPGPTTPVPGTGLPPGTWLPTPAPANTVLADLREAVETYADQYLSVQMYAVDLAGDVLNPGDTATFRLRVRNSGPLHVRGLTLRIHGISANVKVGRHGWTDGQANYTTPPVDTVPAHMEADAWVEVPDNVPGDEHDHFHFWVHAVMSERDLVDVSVQDWNLDLLHLLEGHTDPSDTPHAVYRGEVFPN